MRYNLDSSSHGGWCGWWSGTCGGAALGAKAGGVNADTLVHSPCQIGQRMERKYEEWLAYLHLANAAAGVVVGARVMAGPVAIRSHTVAHIGLVCSPEKVRGEQMSTEPGMYCRG
jgi:hypothetical protein